MKALVLAAGYATRLYPLTKNFPKPLLKVANKSIIDYIIEEIDKVASVDEIIVITNAKYYSKFQEWSKQVSCSKQIRVLDDRTTSDDDKLGAIGDVHFAIENEKLSDELLVVGGDNIFEGSLNDFVEFAKSKGSCAIGIYDLQEKDKAKRYGVVKTDKDGKIVDFAEKPQNPASSLVAMCLYFFPKDKLGLVGKYMDDPANKKDATGFYISWLVKKITVYAFVLSGRWFDIGQRDFLKQADNYFSQHNH